MGRTPCCEKVGLKKGPWSQEEDNKLVAYVEEHGHGNWCSLPAKAGLQRCGKSCRLRWINYLRPDIKRGHFCLAEDRTIIQLHALLGNKWSIIAAHLPKRTDNDVKNYWNSHLKKRLIRMGIDPITHKPKANTIDDQSKDAANMSHMAQWESARLEAEARASMLQVGSCSSRPARLIISKIPPQPSPPPCLDVLKAWQCSRSSDSPSSSSTKHNNNTKYNTYAIMLDTNNELESPTSTLSFPVRNLPVSSTIGTMSYEGDGNIIESSSEKIMEGTVSRLQDDDDIMVAVEEFRVARLDNIPVLSKDDMEGFNNDMQTSNSYERFVEESGYGSFNFDVNSHCWNSLLNLDNDAPSGSPMF